MKKNTNEIAVVTAKMNITTNLDIGNREMVAIVADKVEEAVREQLRLISSDLKKVREKITGLNKQIDDIVDTQAQTIMASKKKILEAFFEAWLEGKDRTNAIKSITISGRVGTAQIHGEGVKTLLEEIPITKEIDALRTQIREEHIIESELSRKDHAFRAKLADLPNMERRAMVALTRHSLQGSSAGKQILDQVDGVIANLGLLNID